MKRITNNLEKYFYTKILLPTLLTISLFITAIFFVVIPQFENIILDRKREMIKELTNSAVSIINKWYLLKEEGSLTEEEAKASAIKIINSLRYGEESKDYFWITDSYPYMIAHPYRPDLEGKSLKNFEDSHGKKLFVEMAEGVKNSGEAYIDYMWQWKDDSTTIVPKLSYVKMFTPWNWIVGTGIYIEDVKEEISKLERKIINISILISVISSVLLFYIAYQNLKSEKKRKIIENELNESRERYKTLVEHSSIGMIMVLKNNQLFFNKTIYDMLGYSSHDDVQLKISDIFKDVPQSRLIDFSSFEVKSNSINFIEQFETKLVKHNGESIDVLLDISPIEFSSNNGVVINVKDISLNKEIEEALDSTKGKYLSLTNQISIGVFRLRGNKLLFTEANPGLADLLGYTNSDELLSLSFIDFFSDTTDAEKIINDLKTDKIIKNRPLKLINKKGNNINVSLSAVLSIDKNGKLDCIDGIVEDITERYISDIEREELITDLQSSILVLNNQVGMYVKPIVSCLLNTSVLEAAKLMQSKDSSALLIKGNSNEDLGLVNYKDLTTRFISQNKETKLPIYNFMSSPIEKIGVYNSIFDAINKFKEKKTTTLLVKDWENNSIGLIDSETIYEASYSAYLYLFEKIEKSDSIRDIEKVKSQLLMLIEGLIKNNHDITTISKLNSIFTDSLTKKIIENAIQEVGKAPCKFAFIVMGSEGRREQTLSTDQDNAIIFEDVSEKKLEEYQNYFLRLGKRISDDLNKFGYKYCKGNNMCSNPKWCKPYTVWKKYFTQWVTEAKPQDLLDLKIFFDFRFHYGDKELSDKLGDHINHLINSYSPFILYLAESSLKYDLPDSVLKMKAPVDIKLILLPVIDFARLYGLKYGLSSSNTLDRLNFIKEKGLAGKEFIDNIIVSYRLLMQLRLKHQSDCISENNYIGNEITLNEISEIEKTIIKKYLEFISEIKEKISLDFKSSILK